MFESVSLLDFDPIELARQLTLIDHRLLSLVPLIELQNGNYLKEEESPFLQACTKRFNTVVAWIGTLVTTNPAVKERRRIISFFIVVSVVCQDLNL